MKKILTLVFCLISLMTFAQGSLAWGVKGGPSIAFQTWNNSQRDALFTYHGDLYVENYDGPDADALYAQIGYHNRGSAVRNINVLGVNGQISLLPTQKYVFNNLVLSTGFKKRFEVGEKRAYYAFGLRGEYTVGNNLDELNARLNSTIYQPFPEAVRKINYGLHLAGGVEFMFKDLIGGVIEFSLSPDLSYQYLQPAIGNVVDFMGVERTIPERKIRNVTAEISVGFRFLRIVEYVD